MRIIRNAWIGILIAVFFAACNSDNTECYVPNSVAAQVGFGTRHYKDTLAADSVHRDTIVSIADTVLTAPRLISLYQDSNVVVSGAYTTQLGMILNPDSSHISYLFQPDSNTAAYDTITVFYRSFPHFVSTGCGFYNYYTLDSMQISQNFIDSFAIVAPEVTNNVNAKNIYIYFRQ